MAVLYTVDHCTRPSQDVAGKPRVIIKISIGTNPELGWAPAYGNGDLMVGTQRN